MKLRYRGIGYESQSRNLEISETDIILRFLGNPYPLRRSQVNSGSQLGLCKYRGVSYGR